MLPGTYSPELLPVLIELQGVSKTFGNTKALDRFDLNTPPSSLITLVGENGAGKSTLLRLLAGVSVPDKSMVRYDSVVFDREKMTLRKRLHFTPDMPLLFAERTVARNISTFTSLYGKTLMDGRRNSGAG